MIQFGAQQPEEECRHDRVGETRLGDEVNRDRDERGDEPGKPVIARAKRRPDDGLGASSGRFN